MEKLVLGASVSRAQSLLELQDPYQQGPFPSVSGEQGPQPQAQRQALGMRRSQEDRGESEGWQRTELRSLAS